MGTSLTPEFWERFTILLVVAVAVTVVLTAALDALAERLPHHPGPGRRPRTGGRPSTAEGRVSRTRAEPPLLLHGPDVRR
ncbi:hypothetical protein [Streptomyces sp. S.PB5]|uniref:hypothetical protein n=1 Tax=Streptomyces sp. S.PB5 TaxID=3020844 RepID=UPI0025B25402|nr:hypothetical protein [Streptomyces sp. S.PB5]MDN3029176.1 hypothetical protein [Streptomyces sp. S.PB5]